MREVTDEAVRVRTAPLLDSHSDDPMCRTFATAVVRVRERSCEVTSPDRSAALRVRIAARQPQVPH